MLLTSATFLSLNVTEKKLCSVWNLRLMEDQAMLSKKLYSVILLWAVSKILIYFGFHHLSYEHAEAMFPIKLFLVFTFHQHVDKAVIRTSGVAVC